MLVELAVMDDAVRSDPIEVSAVTDIVAIVKTGVHSQRSETRRADVSAHATRLVLDLSKAHSTAQARFGVSTT